MTITQLQYFLAAADGTSFLDTAEKLYISQSSLSKNIYSLEKELGVELFDRSRKRATLTDTGEKAYDYIKKIVGDYDQLIHALQNRGAQAAKEIVISFASTLPHYPITQMVRPIILRNPHIHFSFSENNDSSAIECMSMGTVDMGIMREGSLPDNHSFRVYPLYHDRLMVALPTVHPLASSSRLSIDWLKDENFLLAKQLPVTSELILSVCNSAGFSPNTINHLSITSVIHSLSNGQGISLMFSHFRDIYNFSGVSLLPLDPPIHSTTVLAVAPRRKCPVKVEREIVSALQDGFAKLWTAPE